MGPSHGSLIGVEQLQSKRLCKMPELPFATMLWRIHKLIRSSLLSIQPVSLSFKMAAVRSGHIRAVSDVYPQEPLPLDHPVWHLENLILSAHRAGALDVAFKQMGPMVLDDMELINRGLPPWPANGPSAKQSAGCARIR
jgi:D-isomer specific 2-hydroxyacid dehydrogenase, NAD binding domain